MQLILFSKAHFQANVFNEITGITDALKENAYYQNEQTIHILDRKCPSVTKFWGKFENNTF